MRSRSTVVEVVMSTRPGHTQTHVEHKEEKSLHTGLFLGPSEDAKVANATME